MGVWAPEDAQYIGIPTCGKEQICTPVHVVILILIVIVFGIIEQSIGIPPCGKEQNRSIRRL
eukprot:59999-Rhodomonas_salina.2